MNRNNIDFTKTKLCACCGETKNLTVVHVDKYSSYTNCNVLLCKKCYKLGGAHESANGHAIQSLNDVRDAIKSTINSIVAAVNDTISKQIHDNNLIRRYLYDDAFVLNDPHYANKFVIDGWICNKENAFTAKIDAIKKFECNQRANGERYGYYMPLQCPVCNSLIKTTTKNLDKLEINDVVHFACPNHCIEFTDVDLETIYSRTEYEQYVLAKRNPRYRYKYYDHDNDIVPFLYWALVCIANRLHNKIYGHRLEYFNAEVSAKAFGWSKGAKLSLKEVLAKIDDSNKYVASKHCQLFCAHSPGNGKTHVCALTNNRCQYTDGSVSCKRCENYIDGEPIGNLLATHAMCDHYKNGECTACCGKKPSKTDLSNIEHLPTCTFKGEHFILGSNSDACFTISLKGDKLIEKLKTTKGIPYREGYWS